MSARVWVLIEKEWAELRHQRALVWTTVLMAVILVAMGPVVGIAVPALVGQSAYDDPQLQPAYDALREQSPALEELTSKELFQVFIMRQFMVLILVVPVMAGTSIAAYSIVGEKVNRSLEPLLATPVTTSELLCAKTLAAAIPAVVISWMAFLVYIGLVALFTSTAVLAQVANATAVCIVLLITPPIAVLGLSLGIIASSRFTDPRTAQQVGAIVILPIIAVMIMQMRGLFYVTPLLITAGAAAMIIVDSIILMVGARLFRRETILTQWR